MRKVLLFVALFSCYLGFAQLKKVELTNQEVQFIATNGVGFDAPSEGVVNKIIDLNKTIFIVEISLDDKVLYSEAIKRWSPWGSIYRESDREKLAVCLRYSDLDSETLLSFLEDKDWKSRKVGESKFICNDNFPIFKTEREGLKVIFKLNETQEGLKVKLYKIQE